MIVKLWRYRSDQLCSSDLPELAILIKNIHDLEKSKGIYGPRIILQSELNKNKTLRNK